jgi:GT2 family glycosyltransferase
VIVPTRDRPAELTACLESFAALRYPVDRWELIVANDGGPPGAGIPAHTASRVPLRVLDLPHRGPAAARNAAARAGAGELLAFTDDDCLVDADWLTAFARGFAEIGADALGGGTSLPEPAWLGMRASQFVVDFLTAYQTSATGDPLLIVSNNAAYRRTAFEAAGGFDERFPIAAAEDLEMGRRMARLGYRQRAWPAARVLHCHRLSAWGHVRQQFRYGRGGYYFRLITSPAEERRNDHGFYQGLAAAVWRSSLPWGSGALIGAAQAAYQVGMLRERLRRSA